MSGTILSTLSITSHLILTITLVRQVLQLSHFTDNRDTGFYEILSPRLLLKLSTEQGTGMSAGVYGHFISCSVLLVSRCLNKVDCVARILQVLTHLIFMTTLWARFIYSHQFEVMQVEPSQAAYLPKVTHLASW